MAESEETGAASASSDVRLVQRNTWAKRALVVGWIVASVAILAASGLFVAAFNAHGWKSLEYVLLALLPGAVQMIALLIGGGLATFWHSAPVVVVGGPYEQAPRRDWLYLVSRGTLGLGVLQLALVLFIFFGNTFSPV